MSSVAQWDLRTTVRGLLGSERKTRGLGKQLQPSSGRLRRPECAVELESAWICIGVRGEEESWFCGRLNSSLASTSHWCGDSRLAMENTVVSLSPHQPTEPQRHLLAKGLSFYPTEPYLNTIELSADLHAFNRRLRLRDHFAEKPSATNAEDVSIPSIPLSSTPAFTTSRIGSLWKGAPHPKSNSF